MAGEGQNDPQPCPNQRDHDEGKANHGGDPQRHLAEVVALGE